MIKNLGSTAKKMGRKKKEEKKDSGKMKSRFALVVFKN